MNDSGPFNSGPERGRRACTIGIPRAEIVDLLEAQRD